VNSELTDKTKAVVQETLEYLEDYAHSPFDSNTEMAAYIREQLSMPRPQEPETAEDLLREYVRGYAMPYADHGHIFEQIYERARALLDGVPTPSEVRAYLMEGVELKGTSRSIAVATSYAGGHSLEMIADSLNVTRERIRQILAKFVRENNKGV
jgi:DNA-directed RNA polymerase sigma subunit (sigma70/sigma32)